MSKSARHFERFRAIAGQLRRLGESEIKVLWLSESWADPDGTFTASARRLAQELGLTERAVEKAFASLKAKGFLKAGISSTGGRGHTGSRQLIVPINPEPRGGDSTGNPEPQKPELPNGEYTNTVSGRQETPNGGALNPEPRRAHKDTCYQNLLHYLQQGEDPSTFIPESLRTKEFADALRDFHQHRREIRARLTLLTISKLFQKFEQWGPEVSTSALLASVENGWRGVFKPGDQGNGSKRNGIAVHRGRANDMRSEQPKIPILAGGANG